MAKSQNRRPDFLARILLLASRWLTIGTIVLTFFLLIAGTYPDPDYSRPMVMDLGLADLHMVKFSGISNLTLAGRNQFIFHFYLFPNAFSWRCPFCKTGPMTPDRRFVYLAGVNGTGPMWRLDPWHYMAGAVEYSFEDPTALLYDCFKPDLEPHCGDFDLLPFSDVWRKHYPTRFQLVPARLNLVLYFLAGWAAVSALVYEVFITYRPDRMKCSCYTFWNRWCPCPKGELEEIEALPGSFWDSVRTWYFGRIVAGFLAVAVYETTVSILFLRSLQTMDEDMPDGLSMEPQLGWIFFVMLWSCVASSVFAWGCVLGRYKVNQTTEEKSSGDAYALGLTERDNLLSAETKEDGNEEEEEEKETPASNGGIGKEAVDAIVT